MKRASVLRSIEILLVLIFLSVFYLRDIQSVEFHIDESHWIGTSYMFEAYFKGEFWSDAWRISQPTLTNPPVPRYIIGLSRFIGGYRIPDLNRRWDYNYNAGYNIRRGAMPSAGLLWWSRLPMAILAIWSIALGFLLIKNIGGRLPAYLWVLFGATSSYLLLQTRRAMAESSVLWFVMLAAFFCYHAIRTLNQPRKNAAWLGYLYFGFSGFCVGLAGESKINGLSVLLGVIASLAAYEWWKQKEPIINKIRQIFVLSAVVSLVAIVIFFGSYPFLWPDLLGRTNMVLTDRLVEMQAQSISHAPDAITTLNQRLTIIPMRVFQDYAVFHFEGALFLNIILTCLGVGLSLLKIRDWLKGVGDGVAAMVLLATALTAAPPAFFTLLDWDRYYLFPVFFSTVFIALAAGWLGNRAFQWAKTRFPYRTPTAP
jgi:hypothetical protein